jgi:folylpolyglutamate synthase/dihydrofolate synthase
MNDTIKIDSNPLSISKCNHQESDQKMIKQFINKIKPAPSAMLTCCSIYNHQLSANDPLTNSPLLVQYQNSIQKLNLLQIRPVMDISEAGLKHKNIDKTRDMCSVLGLSDNDIKNLNIIHITGTKGKGSTCAFVESILRNSGYKTGLFSSPHLIEVRERIKINGESLSYQKFNKYFNYCYQKLVHLDGEMPSYFQFLTCMMFYAFCEEKIEVGIVEVGIGGRFDHTNIVKSPVVCGFTPIGLDHCYILGNTIEEIAYQKAGIMKPECMSIASSANDTKALTTFLNYSKEMNVPFCTTPLNDDIYDKNMNKCTLNLHGNIQKINSSLAIQLANYWIQFYKYKINSKTWLNDNTSTVQDNIPILKQIQPLDDLTLNALQQTSWPGRNQIIEYKNVKFMIDGAHTTESIQQYIEWFKSIETIKNSKNVLLFNCTGDRNAINFLTQLMTNIKIDSICITDFVAYPMGAQFNQLDGIKQKTNQEMNDNTKRINSLINFVKEFEITNKTNVDFKIETNVYDAINLLTENKLLLNDETTSTSSSTSDSEQSINVLITGSIYLVGLALQVLKYKIK